jgi:hypothetical protein
MKLLQTTLAFLVAVSSVAASRAGRVPELKFGFDAMRNIEQLPLLFPNGTQTRQPLSYDPTGGNWDHHFTAAFTKYVEPVTLPDGSSQRPRRVQSPEELDRDQGRRDPDDLQAEHGRLPGGDQADAGAVHEGSPLELEPPDFLG